MPSRPCIFPSDLAAAVGLNKWKPPMEIATKMAERELAFLRDEQIPVEPLLKKVKFSTPVEANVVRSEAEKQLESVSSRDGAAAAKKRFEESVATLPNKAAVVKSFEKELTKRVGVVEEKVVVNARALERKGLSKKRARETVARIQQGEKVVVDGKELEAKQATDVLHESVESGRKNQRVLHLSGGLNILVYGRIDLIEDEVVVEIKNRKYKLFGKIPKYELVQLHAYMYTTRTQKCRHVERFEEYEKETEVSWDQTLWDFVKEGLPSYLELYHAALAKLL